MKRTVAILAAMTAASAALAQGGNNYDISITNKTTSVITQVRATNLTTKRTRELLGGQTVPSGQRVAFDMRDRSNACEYRFRLTFRDASGSVDLDQVKNVCKMGNWNIED